MREDEVVKVGLKEHCIAKQLPIGLPLKHLDLAKGSGEVA